MKEYMEPNNYSRKFWQVKPIILITTKNKEGKVNIATKTQFMKIGRSNNVSFGCSTLHDTYQNIKQNKEFVINFPGVELLNETVKAGESINVSDELEYLNLTGIEAKKVNVPLIQECFFHLECKLIEMRHYENGVLIIGEVVAACGNKDSIIYNTETSNPDIFSYVYPDHYVNIKDATLYPRFQLKI